ncbi:alpha/beta hydrolase [Flavobacteriaceae bacterium S0862]|nr:alpha/beta hydrolase [Flavobacteriaceae bacterium S0862]
MIHKYLNISFILLILININPIISTNDGFKLVTYTTDDGGIIEASFFEADKDLVVIFAHGAIFNKESWYFMTERLQKDGVSSLSLDFRGYGNSTKGSTSNKSLDILGAVNYLKGKGFNNIAIVGGSMGGAAILNALDIKTDTVIEKVVLLAPAGGKGIANKSIKKLIVVSKDEGLFTRVNKIYIESSSPKELKVYPGSFHAQHMFKADYSNELIDLIIKFLNFSD